MINFKLVLIVVAFLLIIISICKVIELKNIKYNQPKLLTNKKILTIYYSNGTHTEEVAQKLHSIVGGDIKEIKLIEKYPNNIFKMTKLVRKQIKEGYLPEIEDIDILNYDVVFIGSPVWNFSMSLPVKTFLKNNNFENKTVIPFFTYSGCANKKNIMNEISDFTKANNLRKPLYMFENGIFLIKEQLIKWLNNI